MGFCSEELLDLNYISKYFGCFVEKRLTKGKGRNRVTNEKAFAVIKNRCDGDLKHVNGNGGSEKQSNL